MLPEGLTFFDGKCCFGIVVGDMLQIINWACDRFFAIVYLCRIFDVK